MSARGAEPPTPEPSRAELIVRCDGVVVVRRVLAPGERVVLGRGADADVTLADPAVSGRHALVTLDPDGVVRLTDLGSRNGTHVEDSRLSPYEARPLARAARLGAHTVEAIGVAPRRAAQLQEDYEALEELGRGATGIVRLARRRSTGERVAVKTLDLALVPAAQRARLEQEADLRLEHPHVVRTLDVRQEGDRLHLVLELLEGGSLDARLAAGPLPISTALRVTADVARALAAAHTVGVVHRDVKPANILLDGTGRAKLGDFGIARIAGSALTATGQGLGTLAYVAPEQVESARRAGPLADLYALGATLYHLLAGRPPFDPAAPDALERVIRDDPPPLGDLRPGCPAEVVRLVHRLLEKEPNDRVPDASAVVARVEALLARLVGDAPGS